MTCSDTKTPSLTLPYRKHLGKKMAKKLVDMIKEHAYILFMEGVYSVRDKEIKL